MNINDTNGTAVKRLGGRVTDDPGEFPFGLGGYYAVYFRGPDDLKFEIVHMPEAERRMAELERFTARP